MISDNLPNSLKEAILYQRYLVDKDNIAVYDSSQLKKRSFSVLATLATATSKEMYNYTKKSLPIDYVSSLILQPYEGYHISLQWSPKETLKNINVKELVDNIKSSITIDRPISGTIHFPYLSSRSLLGWYVDNNSSLALIRNKLNDVWCNYGLERGITGLKSNFYWVSLIRFKKYLSDREIRPFKDIKGKTLEDIHIKSLEIVYNDPFFSPDKSEILDTITLSVKP